jgi:uncharacterized cupin superfamily protein
MHEAELKQTETGLVPQGDGWWIANLADISWYSLPDNGTWCSLDAADAPNPHFGIGIHILKPDEPSAMYHAESTQEAFIVLAGECRLIVEGQERIMRPWDAFYCAPMTAHITIGAGDGPCAILMVGARGDHQTEYLVDPLAAKYGASVEAQTGDPKVAYAARRGEITPAKAPWPPEIWPAEL